MQHPLMSPLRNLVGFCKYNKGWNAYLKSILAALDRFSANRGENLPNEQEAAMFLFV